MKQKLLTLAILIIALTLTLTSTNSLSAQVTIGSGMPPNKGALLDLKQEGTTTGGLGLPRVTLSNLKPATPAELSASIGNTGNWDLDEHIGLMVYNVKDAVFNPATCKTEGGPGIYLWEGVEWTPLSPNNETIGSYAQDLQALKDIYTSNAGNTLSWNIAGDPATFAGVTWEVVCGERRVTGLEINNKNLSNLDAIGELTVLTTLDCRFNSLTALYVTKNTALTTLDCDYNSLTTLDLAKNTALTYLDCTQNSLTTLDVSGATALTYLDCRFNSLTALDVSGATALTYLDCSWNYSLAALDVSGATALTYLDCTQNSLTTLDVSGATALIELRCSYNALTTLDITNNTDLSSFFCDENQLTQIELNKIKNNPAYCSGQIIMLRVAPQYGVGTTTIDPTVVAPTCP